MRHHRESARGAEIGGEIMREIRAREITQCSALLKPDFRRSLQMRPLSSMRAGLRADYFVEPCAAPPLLNASPTVKARNPNSRIRDGWLSIGADRVAAS